MSNVSPIIDIHELWKSFSFIKRGPDTLKAKVLSFFCNASKQPNELKELYNGLTLSIYPGEVVAFLGKNGSGKSTLLKLISGIYWPDKGEILVRGKMSALIELGAGFHPEFSGRENAIVYGQVLGISKRKILDVMDEIIDFSELGDYIDQPVKVYSSGMYMRLAFSVAVIVDPDVLIIDEILSVGDFSFAKKCMAKMNEFKTKGKTICLVSHDLQTIRSWATRAVVLSGGRVVFDGTPAAAVEVYLGLDETPKTALDVGDRTSLKGSAQSSANNLELWQDRFLTPFMKPVNLNFDGNSEEACWVVVVSSAKDLHPFGYSFLKFASISREYVEEKKRRPFLGFKICVLRSAEGVDDIKNIFSRLTGQPSLAEGIEFYCAEHDQKNFFRVSLKSTFFSLDWVATSQLHSVFQYRAEGIPQNELRHVAKWSIHDHLELPHDEHESRLKALDTRFPIQWDTVSSRMPTRISVSQDKLITDEKNELFRLIVCSDFNLASSKINFARRAIQKFLFKVPRDERKKIRVFFWGDHVDPAPLTPESSVDGKPISEKLEFNARATIFLFAHSHDLFADAEEKLRINCCHVVGENMLERFPAEDSLAEGLFDLYTKMQNSSEPPQFLTLKFQDLIFNDSND